MKYSHLYKSLLLLVVLGTLWLSQIQNKIELIEIKPLEGDISYPEKGSLNLKNWLSGEYQEAQESYLNTVFGFRNICVRINNQIAYSFFGKAKANQVVIGKDTYLYERNYIDTYMGVDFVGADSINHTINKLKFISDTLQKLDKTLLVIFAASKASYYPEFIPENFKQISKNTNYKIFTQNIKNKGINVIDFNAWFIENKTKSKYPLYPQQGIHWSKYGTVLVLDSIIKKIEDTKKIDLPNLYFDTLTMEQAHGVDYDIGGAMNLLFKFKSFDMAYVEPKFENDSNKTKPSVLTISDSFYWQIYNFGLSGVFTKDQFWYYNNQVYPKSFKEETFVDELDFDKEINNHDVFIIMATEPNLKNIGWGFIEKAYAYFKNPEQDHSEQYYARLKQVINYIKVDEKWLNEIKKKAKSKNQELEKQILKEAQWVLKNEGVN